MPVGEGKIQIQVEERTRDAMTKLIGMGKFETYDDLIWAMINKTMFNALIAEVEGFQREVERLYEDPGNFFGDDVDAPLFSLTDDEADMIDEQEIDWIYDEKIEKYFGFKDDKIIFWDKKNNKKERIPLELLKYINEVKKKTT